MDRPEREILVHISAPSGVQDDGHYRAQAQAYFAFQAVSRIKIFPESDSEDNLEDLEDRSLETEDGQGRVGSENESRKPDEEAGLTSGDKLNNIGLPASDIRYRGYSHTAQPVQGSQALNRPQTDSSTTPLPRGSFGNGRDHLASRKRCLTLENFHENSVPLSPAHAVPHETGVPPDWNQIRADSIEFPPSIVQDSQPASLPPVERGVTCRSEHGPGLLQGWPSGMLGITTSDFTDIPEAPNKRQRLGVSDSPRQTTAYAAQSFPNPAIVTSVSQACLESPDISNSQSSFCPSLQSTRATKDTLGTSLPILLPLEIHPLPPAASSSSFKTHVTPTMQMLSDRIGLSRVFNPVRKMRDLRILERGYWSLEVKIVNPGFREGEQQRSDDNSIWPLPLFIRFWSFLSDFVGKEGRAGWGVWCAREPEYTSLGETLELSLPRIEHIKVYTWGEVVPHTYLLLFLASERRIKGMRVCWRDAKDGAVIDMS
jgi:hypothetical protein